MVCWSTSSPGRTESTLTLPCSSGSIPRRAIAESRRPSAVPSGGMPIGPGSRSSGGGIDPLRGVNAHIALNKLGGIGVGYSRNRYGPLPDPADGGLATDRIEIEWWIDSPRVNAVLDRGLLPSHYRFGLDRMEVVTKTRGVGDGLRQLVEFNPNPGSKVILVEIPVDLDRLFTTSPNLARDWRVKAREVFETLFGKGYLLTGFVHEAGRSFHLLEWGRKRVVLEAEN